MSKNLKFLCGVLTYCATAASAVAQCGPPIVNPANGHAYVRIAQPMTYLAARAQAEALGGYLVAINDAAENAFIVQNFAPWLGNRHDWIGLSDQGTPGMFFWLSGEPLTYTNWMSGEPNNLGGEEFVEINLNPSGLPTANFGRWNDNTNLVLNNAIVELPGAAVVNPANGHVYIRTAQAMTFMSARAQAMALGGYLVAINDAAENAFVLANFPIGVPNYNAWIGLTDEIVEGTFELDSGEPYSYTNWVGGEPNNGGGNEDYVEIKVNFNTTWPGRWNDQGSGLNFGIIEYAPSGPTPMLSLLGSSGPGGANLSLWAGGVPCGGTMGATLLSLTPAVGGPGTGPFFGLQHDIVTLSLLLLTQPGLPPAVEPWMFDLLLPGAAAAYPYLPWNAPWGSTAVFATGTTADLALIILTPVGIAASNVVRFTF